MHIEPRPEGGVYMVATNGHLMGIAIDETGYTPCAATISVGRDIETEMSPERVFDDDGDELEKRWPSEFRLVTFDMPETGCSTIARIRHSHPDSASIQGLVTRIDGPFPDWRSVLKVKDRSALPSGPVGMYSSAYLARLSFEGRSVLPLARAGVPIGFPKDRATAAMVLIDGAPWAIGFLSPDRKDGWTEFGALARELLDDTSLPENLGTWPATSSPSDQ